MPQSNADLLDPLLAHLEAMIEPLSSPVVIALEICHFSLPITPENRAWAEENMAFAERLAGALIKRYGRSVRLIPVILINNLDIDQNEVAEHFIARLSATNRYITSASIKRISERNLKNRAYKMLKHHDELADAFVRKEGKAYLKNAECVHDMAVGFVTDEGEIIPRCGLILTSFFDRVSTLARQRLHTLPRDPDVVLISFSQHHHEYKRVKLGIDIYTQTHSTPPLHPAILHWDPSHGHLLLSSRMQYGTWHEESLMPRRTNEAFCS